MRYQKQIAFNIAFLKLSRKRFEFTNRSACNIKK